MNCPACGAWGPADPETGYDADELCPNCRTVEQIEEGDVQVCDRCRSLAPEVFPTDEGSYWCDGCLEDAEQEREQAQDDLTSGVRDFEGFVSTRED